MYGKGHCLGKCQFHDGTEVIHAEALGGGDMGGDTSPSPAPSGNPSAATSAIITSSHPLPMVEGGESQ